MATSTALLLCVICISCVVVPGLATVYTVGDSAGWSLGVDYDTWASGKTFVPGDSLVFNYGSSHSVDEVKANDYSSCTVGNPIKSDSSGATTVQLQAPGTRNFICGIPSHCSGGMKLTVTVNAASTAPVTVESPPPSKSTGSETTNDPSSTTIAPPSDSSNTDTDTTTTTTTSTPPPSTTVATPAPVRNPAVTTRTVPSSSVIVSPVISLIFTWAAIMWKFFM